MIFHVAGFALLGVDAFKVDLEVDITRKGIPAFTMVGLAEGAVREAKERVFAALKNARYAIPPSRITVNLAPADRKKGGSGYDLPLAVGLLGAAGYLRQEVVHQYLLAGELSLSGEVRPIPGILPMAILARNSGFSGIIVPKQNAAEAAVVTGISVYAVTSLHEVVELLSETACSSPLSPSFSIHNNLIETQGSGSVSTLDFSEVKGQEHAKRAVTVAAAGGHNILFVGPPGSGKTMLAERIPGILPPLSFEEALEVSKVYSVAGLLEPGKGLLAHRPFRAPHHTISRIGLVGGGSIPRPGELSLAHKGVLFLDELPEFGRQTLEVLRQPLEKGSITITRVGGSIEFPADVMLVAAMNPCPCGYATDPKHTCVCTPYQIQQYHARLSGPLLDRIDMYVEVPAVPFQEFAAKSSQHETAGTTRAMRHAVVYARRIQIARYEQTTLSCNADLSGRWLEEFCPLSHSAQEFLACAAERLALSARACSRIIRIARTIADLDGTQDIEVRHLAEAVNYRIFDRKRK